MTDQITTITMTPDQMLAYESGRKAGLDEARCEAFDFVFRELSAVKAREISRIIRSLKESQP